MPMKLRLGIPRCYIEPYLLHGSETWTLRTADKKTLMASEMWFLRRMLKINRIDKVTNEEVLKRAGTKRWMMNAIDKRHASFSVISSGSKIVKFCNDRQKSWQEIERKTEKTVSGPDEGVDWNPTNLTSTLSG